jgi:hypothetical protein
VNAAVTAGAATSRAAAGSAAAGSLGHGRNTVLPRAVRRVVSAVTAEQLGVDASDVSVDLSDNGGALTVTANTPIHVAPLGSGAVRPAPIVQRLGEAQATIRSRCLALTGSSITRVDLRVTGVELNQRRRVK